MKLNKSPGFDNISAEHLVYGGPALYIHLCLLFNAMMQHCFINPSLTLSSNFLYCAFVDLAAA